MKQKPITSYLDIIDRLKQREDLLRIFILTVFTVFCWIGLSIYLSQQKTKIPPDIQKFARPLTPTIDRDVLDEISARKTFTEEELNNFVLAPQATPEITIETQLIATESSEASPSASVEADLDIVASQEAELIQ